MDPLSHSLSIIESDNSSVCDVIPVVKTIKQLFNSFPGDDMKHMKARLQRLNDSKYIWSVHFLSHLLHHKERGQHLTPFEKADALTFLDSFAMSNNIDASGRETAGHSLEKFMSRTGIFDNKIREGVSTPLKYWQHIGEHEEHKELSTLAVKIVGIPSSSASVERSFSSQGKVHTGLRSSLTKENVDQIMTVKWFKSRNETIMIERNEEDDDLDNLTLPEVFDIKD